MENYPAVIECNEETGEDEVHPIAAAIRNGAKLVMPLSVVNVFEDDHLPCCDVQMVMSDGVTYELSLWWLSMEGLQAIFRAGFCEEATRMLIDDMIMSIADSDLN